MNKSEYKIMLCEDIVKQLKVVANKEDISIEECIQNLVVSKFEKDQEEESMFPSVALIKEGLNLSPVADANAKNSLINKEIPSHKTFEVANTHIQQANPELVQRRKDVETKMKELSLLIETASEDKKNGYVMQYAQLAAELNALL